MKLTQLELNSVRLVSSSNCIGKELSTAQAQGFVIELRQEGHNYYNT